MEEPQSHKAGIFVNVIFLVLASSIFYGMMYFGKYADEQIIGKWKEKSWNYEKVDIFEDSDRIKDIERELKQEVSQDLIVHQGEIWEFLPGNKLKIYMEEGEPLTVDFKFKGRGQILKIIHDGEILEHYTIQKISPDELILNFYVETQARGIVKLTFERA